MRTRSSVFIARMGHAKREAFGEDFLFDHVSIASADFFMVIG